jgi:hypothetical protein
MPEVLNLLAPLLLGYINRENLPKRVRKKKEQLWLFLVKQNKTKQKTVPKGWLSKLGLLLRQSWDAYVSLAMAGQIMHPSNGILTMCVYMCKHLQNGS